MVHSCVTDRAGRSVCASILHDVCKHCPALPTSNCMLPDAAEQCASMCTVQTLCCVCAIALRTKQANKLVPARHAAGTSSGKKVTLKIHFIRLDSSTRSTARPCLRKRLAMPAAAACRLGSIATTKSSTCQSAAGASQHEWMRTMATIISYNKVKMIFRHAAVQHATCSIRLHRARMLHGKPQQEVQVGHLKHEHMQWPT